MTDDSVIVEVDQNFRMMIRGRTVRVPELTCLSLLGHDQNHDND